MIFKMSHDSFSKMFVYSLLLHPLSFAHIHSPVTRAVNECVHNIPVAATWIHSCLVFGISCLTSYLFFVHIITYPTGACAVFLSQCLISLTMDQGISQVLVLSTSHNWSFLTLLSSCQTYVTQAGYSKLSYGCLAGVWKR